MRLIDADIIDFNKVFKGASDFARDTREAAQKLINAQPTAYNVDKVVEQLEELKSEYNMLTAKCSVNIIAVDALRKAIEIVKAESYLVLMAWVVEQMRAFKELDKMY